MSGRGYTSARDGKRKRRAFLGRRSGLHEIALYAKKGPFQGECQHVGDTMITRVKNSRRGARDEQGRGVLAPATRTLLCSSRDSAKCQPSMGHALSCCCTAFLSGCQNKTADFETYFATRGQNLSPDKAGIQGWTERKPKSLCCGGVRWGTGGQLVERKRNRPAGIHKQRCISRRSNFSCMILMSPAMPTDHVSLRLEMQMFDKSHTTTNAQQASTPPVYHISRLDYGRSVFERPALPARRTPSSRERRTNTSHPPCCSSLATTTLLPLPSSRLYLPIPKSFSLPAATLRSVATLATPCADGPLRHRRG